MFIDTFAALCEQKNISMNKACIEIGISRTATAKWKNGYTPTGQTLAKISDYFGVSVDYLLGKEQKETPTEPVSVSDDDIRFALFGGTEGITDEMFEEVKRFAKFVKEREQDK